MRGAGLNASWSGVIPTMGLSVPVVMDPLCGIARGCDDIFAPGDGDYDDGDGWLWVQNVSVLRNQPLRQSRRPRHHVPLNMTEFLQFTVTMQFWHRP